MFFSYIFNKPTSNQKKVFEAVSPIIERVFPKATSFVSCQHNEVIFTCGYTEQVSPCEQKCYPPEENKLDQLADYLNKLSYSQNSKIKFQVWCEDIGGAIPMGIVASWD